MNRPLLMMLGSLLLLAGLIALLRSPPPRPALAPAIDREGEPGKGEVGFNESDARRLQVYCAASNRAVLEAVRADYERDFGIAIDIQFGPSQTLLSTAEVGRTGDLYLPADDSYIDLARDKGLIEEELPLAKMQGVVAVRKGNPKQIRSFADLLRDDVKLVQANVEAAAISKLTREELTSAGLWDALHEHTVAYRTTVQDVASDVKVGSADAGIVYDAVLTTYPDLEAVRIPELNSIQGIVMVSVLKSAADPARALHFARYLSSSDKGLTKYREFGFNVAGGDAWEESPVLTLYAGSMLRPAVEQTLREFEQREGVQITTVYNGCGILVGQMKAGQIPDAYFACDTEFMTQVKDFFPTPRSIAQNELVIMVEKGNPHGISGLQDLAKEGLRVGIGHEKQCAMGWLTQKTLTEGGVKDQVMANVAVQTPSGDMLVNQMQAGSLDAAVVYLSNTIGAGGKFDAVRISNLPCSVATQPFAVAKNSPRRRLAERLAVRLQSLDSQQRFEQSGFVWKASEEKQPEVHDQK